MRRVRSRTLAVIQEHEATLPLQVLATDETDANVERGPDPEARVPKIGVVICDPDVHARRRRTLGHGLGQIDGKGFGRVHLPIAGDKFRASHGFIRGTGYSP